MNYVDPILRYLSGELSPEEQKSFRESLDSNKEMKQEFDDISAAFEMISDQLVQRDEQSFRQKLLAAMDREPPYTQGPYRRNRRWWITLVAIAATLALVLVIWMKPTGKDRMLSRYYSPHKDPVILSFQQDTRGSQEEGILYFRNGLYEKAMQSLETLSVLKADDKLILLYYLLSAMELDKEEEIIDELMSWEFQHTGLADQSLAWYASLALIKTDHPPEALSLLEALASESGPYRADAENLLKLLLK